MLEGVAIDKHELEMLRRHVLFIGGGTCSGKSTLANDLADALHVESLSADDRLGDYANLAAVGGSVFVRNAESVNLEHFWMRDPYVQLDEMLGFYQDVFPHVIADVANRVINAASTGGERSEARVTMPLVVAEGVVFLPDLLDAIGIPAKNCFFLVAGNPEHDQRYAQRDWVPLMLEGCADPQEAFSRWMQRDELFAEYVRNRCANLGIEYLDTSDTSVLHDCISRLKARL